MHYCEDSMWMFALKFAQQIGDETLKQDLIKRFEPILADPNFVATRRHVDNSIFGIVPLELYIQTGQQKYLDMGKAIADRQWENPRPDGLSAETRFWIDDMYMLTVLQVQAYRATGDESYLNFMSAIMVDYLGAQQSNGLFFHNVDQAPVHWGRGNGWFAAGMAEIMRDLPEGSADYQTILAGYTQMMESLLPLQGPNGLWYQVLDMPDHASNWEESSCTGMFTYAMVAGVRRCILDADTYVPVIFAGAGVQAARVDRAVTPYDIAPTLSAYLSVKPPSGAVGSPLAEVLAE